MNRVPLIVVFGATGSGKSKLAIELALKYNGEIISADSMQVYKKLDIITNKVTQEERNLVPHHIIDFLNPLKRYSVIEFRNHALKTIDEIVQRKKIPVIVGGTNYYIEAILWKILVDSNTTSADTTLRIEDKLEGVENKFSATCSASREELLKDRSVQSSNQNESQMEVESDNLRENLFSSLFYCQSILQYVQDSLRAPVSTLFECIEPVYSIQPQVPPEELESYPSRIFNKIFGQVDAIKNIKRHHSTIQLTIRIIDELFELIFNLQKLMHSVKGTVGDPETRTYTKHVLLPNLISTNVFVFTKFISALFPEMSAFRTEIRDLLEQVDKILSDSEFFASDSEARQEFFREVEKVLKFSQKKLNSLVQELKNVVVVEEECLLHLPSPEIHERLKAVDPQRAACLHPNDRRKVFRSLQVYLRTGKTHSELLREQKSEAGASDLGGPLRFSNTCVFWIKTDQVILDARLDKRVDEMVEKGLVQELTDFHDEYNASRLRDNKSPDYTKGIFQSIGFKEFHDYLILDQEERETRRGQKILRQCVDHLKISTRRYSRYQVKWVKNRFFRSKNREIPPVYGVSSDNVDKWDEEVLEPACEVVKYLLEDELGGLSQCPIKPIPKETDYKQQERHKDFYCEVCERLFIGTLQWEEHLKSKKHKKVVALKKKEASQKEDGLPQGST